MSYFVKTFTDFGSDNLDAQINRWIEAQGQGKAIPISASLAIGSPNVSTQPCLNLSIIFVTQD